MEITVKIIQILNAQKFTSQRTGNEYIKNTFVGETQGQYPKKIAFSVMGEEKFNQMGIVVGGTYSVSFDVESREWQGKWFTEANAWRAVNMEGGQAQAPTQQPVQQVAQPQAPANNANNGGGEGGADDQPF